MKKINKQQRKEINEFMDKQLRDYLGYMFDMMWEEGKHMEDGNWSEEMFQKYGVSYRDVLEHDMWNSEYLSIIEFLCLSDEWIVNKRKENLKVSDFIDLYKFDNE